MEKYSERMANAIEDCVNAWSQVQEEAIKKGLERLAAYEDTGLEPEEIVRMGMAYQDSNRYSGRLELKLKPYLDIGISPSELNSLKLASMGKCVVEIREFDGVPIDRLRELAQADKEERLVVLPAKTVYELVWGAGPGCDLICPVSIDGAGLCSFCDHGKLGVYETVCTQELMKHLGETIFLIREEAEAALKERGADNS